MCARRTQLFLQVGPKAFPRVAMDLATTVERIQQNFVICDPSLPDCPIVFASDAFLELTGYPREEVLGRNCRFLQVGRVVFVRILGGGYVQEWGCCWCRAQQLVPGLNGALGAAVGAGTGWLDGAVMSSSS